MPTELHYIEQNTRDALRQNPFSREGYLFQGWLYEDRLYAPGQDILMPGRNMVTLAMWAKSVSDPEVVSDEPEPQEERDPLDPVPRTGGGAPGQDSTPQPDRMELYIETRKKEDEQNTEN